jgi:multidrug efflux pump subunit AcrA (membrane-fusion protein)
MSRRSGWIAAGLLALALAALPWLSRSGPTAKPAAPTTAALQLAAPDIAHAATQPLVRTVALSGSVQALRSALVKARVAAELKVLDLREGEPVRAGQVLARLDDTEFAWRLRQAEDQAANARTPARVVPLSALRLDGARPALLLVQDRRVKRVDLTPGDRGLASFGGAPEPALAVGDAVPESAVVLRGSVGLLASGTPVALP